MELYYVVLQLQGSCELKFKEGKDSPQNFWGTAAQCINRRSSKIISVRQDTGISEDLRKHLNNSNGFSTYVLFYLMLNRDEVNNRELILQKAADLLKIANYETVVDTDENFQLVMADYIDMNDITVNGQWSA
jgi:hypothetical protein